MKFKDYAKDLGFEDKNNIYVKEVNGYTVYLKNFQYIILQVPSFYIPLDKELTKDELKELTEAAYQNACFVSTTSNKNDTLIITLPEGNKKKEYKQQIMNEILDNVTKKLIKFNYHKLTICPICKKEALYNNFGQDFIPIHDECKNKYIEEIKTKIKEESGFRFSYILEILLSIIGISIGLIPSILLLIFTGDYFTGLLALVPILGVLLSLLPKAPKRKDLSIVIGTMISLVVIGMIIFTVIYSNSNIEESYLLIDGGKGIRKIIFGSIISLAGFGILRFTSKFKKNYKDELKKFEN